MERVGGAVLEIEPDPQHPHSKILLFLNKCFLEDAFNLTVVYIRECESTLK